MTKIEKIPTTKGKSMPYLPLGGEWREYFDKIEVWRRKTRKQLQETVNNLPKYPDDVGGMYSYEIQMYSAEVDKVFEKLKGLLEAFEG